MALLVVGIMFVKLNQTQASVSFLHDLEPGTTIKFSGSNWKVLEQMPNGETYIMSPTYYPTNGWIKFDKDNSNLFDPSKSNTFAARLNGTYYNSMSQKEFVADHSWDRVSYSNGNDGSDYGNVTCKIGLLSAREFLKYKSQNVLPTISSSKYWTRTPDALTGYRVIIHTSNGLNMGMANQENIPAYPTCYLKSGTFVDQNNAVVGILNPPMVPSGLSAVTTSSILVNLTWQANTEQDLAGYRIYRDNNLIADIEKTSINHTDDAVMPGITYNYSISAYNTESLESEKSAPITVTTPPATPTGLSGNASGRTISLTWEGPGNQCYIIERSSNKTDFAHVAEVSETVFTETHELWGTKFYYRIAQKGQDGAVSVYSEAVQVTTEPVPAPTELTASMEGNNISLSWQAVEGVNTYIVERSTGGKLWEEIATVTAPTYTDTVTDTNTEYFYRVRADGGNQVSAPSNTVGSTLTNPEPVAPRLSYSVDNMNIRVSWNIQDVSGYRVYINDELKDELPGNAREYSFSGDTGLTYKIKVEAFNPYGSATATLTVKVGSFTTPGAAKMVGDIASNAGVVFGSLGGLLALSLAFKGAGPLIDAARKVIGL